MDGNDETERDQGVVNTNCHTTGPAGDGPADVERQSGLGSNDVVWMVRMIAPEPYKSKEFRRFGVTTAAFQAT